MSFVEGDLPLEGGSVIGSEDLYVGDFAEVQGVVGGGVDAVEFYPKDLAGEVEGLIGVGEDLFLEGGRLVLIDAGLYVGQRVRLGVCGGGQEQQGGELYDGDFHVNLLLPERGWDI